VAFFIGVVDFLFLNFFFLLPPFPFWMPIWIGWLAGFFLLLFGKVFEKKGVIRGSLKAQGTQHCSMDEKVQWRNLALFSILDWNGFWGHCVLFSLFRPVAFFFHISHRFHIPPVVLFLTLFPLPTVSMMGDGRYVFSGRPGMAHLI